MELIHSIVSSPPLSEAQMTSLKREAIFGCCKWDPQVGDVSVISDFALLITPDCWRFLSREAEQLYRETLAVEKETARSPALIKMLGLPPALESVLIAGADRPPPPQESEPRIMRFDFHLTDEGWKISEVNSDVPGGYIEAAGISALMAPFHPKYDLCADPVAGLISALKRRGCDRGRIALVHATAYSDDRQVMVFLQRRLRQEGLESVLLSPEELQWNHDHALTQTDPLDALLRFFPVEWLPNLRGRAWKNFFRPTATIQLNPGQAAISQSKRFPLTWAALSAAPKTWARLLPPTMPWQPKLGSDWVSKPGFGRVGDGIGLCGVTTEAEWLPIRKSQNRNPGAWIAQRRFNAVSCDTPSGPGYPCLGVYVIDGRVAGVYGRIAPRALIDHLARDVTVLVTRESDTAFSSLKSA